MYIRGNLVTAYKADEYKIYTRDFSGELHYMGVSCPVCDSVLQTLWHEHYTLCIECNNFITMHNDRLISGKLKPLPTGFVFVELSKEHPNYGVIKNYDELIDINLNNAYRPIRINIKDFVPKKNFLYKTSNGSILRYTHSEKDLTSDTVFHRFIAHVIVDREKLIRIFSKKAIPIIGETMFFEGPIFFFKRVVVTDLQIITEIGKYNPQ